jgi:hypothetical protein
MDMQIEECLASLRSRHMNGIFAENSEVACRKILDLIPQNAVVGIGDSTAVKQIGIVRALVERGTKVLDPFESKDSQIDPKEAYKYTERVTKEATLSDVFLTGTNALTQDGRLVNVDGNGNRVAGMFWGHPISIIVVGKNKIVRDLDEAFHRIRNTIAPNHAYIRTAASRGRKLRIPCAETGECRDCRSSDRVCNIFTILEGKPFHTDLNVIIVDEDLGLGWDASWPKSRIKQIIDNHKKFLWIPMFDVL